VEPLSLHLKRLFQEIHFQHFVIYTKRDEFLRRHIAKGHCGTEPSEMNSFQNLVTEKESKAIPRQGLLLKPRVTWGLGKAAHILAPGAGQFLQSLGFGKNSASWQLASKLFS
jgi:hypothetical protein